MGNSTKQVMPPAPPGFEPVAPPGFEPVAPPDNTAIKKAVQDHMALSPIIEQAPPATMWDKFFDIFRPSLEARRASAQITVQKAQELGLKPHEVIPPSVSEAAMTGFQSSVTGLLPPVHDRIGQTKLSEYQLKNLPLTQRIVMQGANIAGDAPFMAAGAFLGLESPVTALGGAFALPAGMRKVLMDEYAKGHIDSFGEFWKRVYDAADETVKGYATGAATSFAGAVGGIPAEIGAMTVVGNALHGKVPEPKDFLDAAVLVGALSAVPHVSAKFRDIYTKTGKTPVQVLSDIDENPEIRRSMLSRDKGIPKEYKPDKIKSSLVVQRIEEPGVKVDFNKPQGLYTTPADVTSPHEDLGGERIQLEINPDAEILNIPPFPGEEVAMRRGATNAGAGVHMARKFLGKTEFEKLKSLNKQDLTAWAAENYPDYNFSRYYDSQEVMEAIGGIEARDRGIDVVTVKNPASPQHDETVILNSSALVNAPDTGSMIPEPAPVDKEPKPKFTFKDPELEKKVTAARGIRSPKFWDRMTAKVKRAGMLVSREFEHIPRGEGEFAQLTFDLRKLAKQHGISAQKSIIKISQIVGGLNSGEYNIFWRKVLFDDLAETAKEGKKIPFGLTPEVVSSELNRLNAAINRVPKVGESLIARKRMWGELKDKYVKANTEIGNDVSDLVSGKNYFRHQVLDYAETKSFVGSGRKLKTPTGRGFMRQRVGSELDINTDYLQAEHEVMSQMIYDTEVAKTIIAVDKGYNTIDQVRAEYKRAKERLARELRLKKVREIPDEVLKKEGLDDWRKLIPEGSRTWQPRDGNAFYLADTIPASLAEKLAGGALKNIGITKDQVRQVLAVGGKRREFVLKNEVADTLDALTNSSSTNLFSVAHKELLRQWKMWQLESPRRFFKYNIRNITGDADPLFVGNPKTFKEVPASIKELIPLFKNDAPLSGDIKDWFERGGMESNLQVQEMGELNKLSIFTHLEKQRTGAAEIPAKVWKAYWKTSRLSTDFRESILRFASYKAFLKELQGAPEGLPKDYAASIPGEVRGLFDIKDRAYLMSNDLMGAYDRVGIAGRAIREHLIPFWSWKEANFRRYHRLFVNAATDDRLTEVIGRKALGSLIKSPYTALRVGKFLIKASAFWAALQVWNNLKYPEEEKSLPPEIRNRPHVLLGRDADGKILAFTRIGAFSDLLDWAGLDAAPQYVDAWLQGKMSVKDIALEMAKSPVNVIVQGGEPFVKLGSELLSRRALFPDVFNPRTVRDRMLYTMQSFGLENEYIALANKPSRGYLGSIRGAFLYTYDPLQIAYSDFLNLKRNFIASKGGGGEGFWITPRGNALYNAKLAMKYRDKKAAVSAMGEYLRYGGTLPGIVNSINAMAPLHGIKKQNLNEFMTGLSTEDKKTFIKAQLFFIELKTGKDFTKILYGDNK